MTKNLLGKLLTKKGMDATKDLTLYELLDEQFIKNSPDLSITDREKLMIVSRQFAEVNSEKSKMIEKIKSPQCVYDVMSPILKNKKQEEFYVLCLDTKNKIIHKEMIYRGSLNASIVHPREVFKKAVMYSSANIIVVHNHPSGDPSPSHEDAEVTRRLKNCGHLFGIELLDHIIIGEDRFVSLKEKGLF